MSKFIIRKEKGAKLKVITPEAGGVWKSINWSEVERMVEKKMELMGLNPGTGGANPRDLEQTPSERTSTILEHNKEQKNKNDLGGRIIEEDII